MVDRIDKFLASLSEEQLVNCRDRINILIGRSPLGR
jgi:hypothetical protein